MSSFSNKLKQIRIERGFTQRKLAYLLGASPAAYSLWEKGEREPRFEILEKLCQILNIDISYLMDWNDTTNEKDITYYANNISNINSSNVVQSSNSVAVNDNISNQKDLFNLSEEEKEILNIYRSLNIRDKAKFLNAIIEINDEKN